MVHEIVLWPDPRLREKAAPITTIDPGVRTLVADMLETLYATSNGIGLAAPQIGVSRRVVVIDMAARTPEARKPMVFINPTLVRTEGKVPSEESCLSIPGESGEVQRFAKVTVKALDLEGKEFTLDSEEMLAIALQHETDHLEGVVFVDHLSSLKRELIKRRMKRLKAERARRSA